MYVYQRTKRARNRSLIGRLGNYYRGINNLSNLLNVITTNTTCNFHFNKFIKQHKKLTDKIVTKNRHKHAYSGCIRDSADIEVR